MAEHSDGAWPVPWESVAGERGGPRARLEYAAYRAVVGGALGLPRGLRERLIGGVARLVRAVDRRHTAAARRFVRQALGDDLDDADVERRVLTAYRHLLRLALEGEELVRAVSLADVERHFDVELSAEAEAVRRAGGGSIFVTPHVGNWEASVLMMPRLGFTPFYAIAKPIKNRYLSMAAQRSRERGGVRLLSRKGAMRSVPTIVRAGGSVGMLLDHRGKGRSVVAPFFGRPALCERAAGVLLRRLRAPVLVGACYLTERPLHYRLVVTEVIRPEELQDASLEEAAARVNRAQEALILARPEQYFWLHDRYRKAPDELPPDGPGGTAGAAPGAPSAAARAAPDSA